jgi:hypothetical protein
MTVIEEFELRRGDLGIPHADCCDRGSMSGGVIGEEPAMDEPEVFWSGLGVSSLSWDSLLNMLDSLIAERVTYDGTLCGLLLL